MDKKSLRQKAKAERQKLSQEEIEDKSLAIANQLLRMDILDKLHYHLFLTIEEQKEILEKKGYVFSTSSDTEVVLASYKEWGEKCVDKFVGMWAFAIWDNKKSELFCSRDRFGIKPFFYIKNDNQFIFASEMKAIYPFLTEVKASNDFHWMKNNTFLYEGTDKCLVDGIKRFPLGHNGIYKDGNLSFKRYWNTLDHLVTIPETYEAQVEKFRELSLGDLIVEPDTNAKINISNFNVQLFSKSSVKI